MLRMITKCSSRKVLMILLRPRVFCIILFYGENFLKEFMLKWTTIIVQKLPCDSYYITFTKLLVIHANKTISTIQKVYLFNFQESRE